MATQTVTPKVGAPRIPKAKTAKRARATKAPAFDPVTLELIEVVKTMREQAFTPEMLKTLITEMKKPYVDEAMLAREKREAEKTKRDMDQQRILVAKAQSLCRHKYKNGGWAIATVHNFPDRQTRGQCNHCRIWIEPAHWEVGFDQKPVLVPEHPLYQIVREIEAETAWQLVG
jgi:hypothetical protein